MKSKGEDAIENRDSGEHKNAIPKLYLQTHVYVVAREP